MLLGGWLLIESAPQEPRGSATPRTENRLSRADLAAAPVCYAHLRGNQVARRLGAKIGSSG
jgi:hypothetical protein